MRLNQDQRPKQSLVVAMQDPANEDEPTKGLAYLVGAQLLSKCGRQLGEWNPFLARFVSKSDKGPEDVQVVWSETGVKE